MSASIVSVNVTKVQPALYHMRKLPWAWVKLCEVADIVGLSIEEVWPTYKHIAISQDKINVAWEDNQEEVLEHDSFMWECNLSELPLEKLQNVFVPAGWGLKICKDYSK